MINKIKKLSLILLSLFFLQGAKYVIDASTNAIGHNNNGLYFLELGNIPAAITEFNIAISLLPDKQASAAFYDNLGTTYVKIGYYKEAIECFKNAITLDHSSIDFYKNLANAHKKNNSLSAAKKIYTKAAQKDVHYWILLGCINLEMGNKSGAIASFKKFQKAEPDLFLTQSINKILAEL